MCKEFITITEKEITSDHVLFVSDCTVYANEYRIERYDIKQLLKRCTKICKELKAKGCKVSHKYKSRKTLQDNQELYLTTLAEYDSNFNMVIEYAKHITSKPLPIGTADNGELKAMYSFRRKADELTTRSSILTRVVEFKHRLDELEEELNKDSFNLSCVYF